MLSNHFAMLLIPAYTEVKHFLIDVSSGQYQFLGSKQIFPTLADLLRFYRYIASYSYSYSPSH